jgi:hypothetical protein
MKKFNNSLWLYTFKMCFVSVPSALKLLYVWLQTWYYLGVSIINKRPGEHGDYKALANMVITWKLCEITVCQGIHSSERHDTSMMEHHLEASHYQDMFSCRARVVCEWMPYHTALCWWYVEPPVTGNCMHSISIDNCLILIRAVTCQIAL